ncbi:SDR family NAD(P)-dependent oxidoreductase [Pseudomonas sp. H11T01]|uniref:SDR family NAD(P)-dependent oxidoreductase n=1 Tax=Pseudomonas sp. H11T01 TaxID=3402749 RepID=UPI003ACA67F3
MTGVASYSQGENMQAVDKSVLITGAISGLGLALIEAFLKAGGRANICRVSRSRPACAKSPRVKALPMDVTDPEQIR